MTAKQINDTAAFIRGLADQRGRNAVWAERAVRDAVSLTAAEALQQNVIDLVATNITDLLMQIDGRKVQVAGGKLKLETKGLITKAQPPDWRHRLLLALFALQLLPVNYAALALILLGFALLAAELVTPAFGVLGVGGVVAFIAGGLMLFDRDVPGLGVPLPLIFGLALTAAAAVLLGGSMALRARRAPVVSGAEQLIGAPGEVTQVIDGQTWALVHGEHWQVRAKTPLQPGQRVRGVVFQLGRFWKVKGPGLVIVIPGLQQMVRVDLRVVTMDVEPKDVISRDNVSVKVNAVIFFRVVAPDKAIIQVEDYLMATSQLAQTTLRVVLGKHELDEMLAERERLNLDVQQILDAQAQAQAEAERERRAKVIHAEGEKQAAVALLEAAKMLAQQPEALQLRYLQTMTQVAGDRASTIVLPLPMDLLARQVDKPARRPGRCERRQLMCILKRDCYTTCVKKYKPALAMAKSTP